VKHKLVATFNQFVVDLHTREIILGSIIGLAVKVLAAGSVFLMNIVVARKLGVAEAGLFFLGFTLVTFVAAVGRMGLDNSVVRFVASAHVVGNVEKLQGVCRKATVWVIALCVALMLIMLALNQILAGRIFDHPGFGPVLLVMALSVPLVGLYNIYSQVLKGLKKVAQSMITLNVTMPVVMLIGLLLPVTTAREVSWIFLPSCAITALVGYLWMRRNVPAAAVADFPSSVLMASCMPLWGVMILQQCVLWSSQLMLGAWSSAEDVALFSSAQRTALLPSFILVAVNAIAAPKFAAMHSQNDMDGLRRMALISVRLMLLAAVPALVFTLLFPEWLMSLFGQEYRAAAGALVILALGQFVNIATGSVGFLLSMTGHERELRFNVFIAALLGIALGALLIPSQGLIGGAIATGVAVASQNLLGVYQVRRRLGFNTLIFWRAI